MNLRFPTTGPAEIVAVAELTESTTALVDRVVMRLDNHLQPCETALAELFENALSPDQVHTAIRALQDLSRWLDELGSPVQARTALKVGAGLKRRLEANVADPVWAVEAAEMIEELRSFVAVPPTNHITSDGRRLLFLGPLSEEMDTLMWSALGAGFAAYHGLTELGASPDLIIIAAASIDGVDGVIDPARQAEQARGLYPQALILIAKETIDVAQQLALSVSCDALIPGPLRPAAVLEESHRLMDRRRSDLRLVQLVSNQGPTVDELHEAGVVVTPAEDAAKVISELETGQANGLVVTSASVGEHDALISLIRSRPDMREAAIVEVTMTGLRQASYPRPGSRPDALVAAELGPVGIVDAVAELVRRRSEIGVVARSGATKGLPWFSGRARAERLLVLARRHENPATLIIIKFAEDRPESEIDEIQADLSRQFRDDDVVARRSGRENLVVLSGVGRRTAMSRLNGIVRRFGALEPRAAIAEFPYDGRDFDTLLASVDGALERSERHEVDPVIGVDWSERSSRAHNDVLLVEPDVNLSSVLEAMLIRTGLTVHSARTGDAALAILLDPSVPKPRLVVLEFDLPGLDGLSILRQLERAGALSRLNVVMLGARTREADLAAAFDLGVIDVVRKPVSPRIAVRRFQRSMDR